MPYITFYRRHAIFSAGEVPANAGELNYLVTMYIQTLEITRLASYIRQVIDEYVTLHTEKYQTYNDVFGALDCAKREMLRRGKYNHLARGIIDNLLDELYYKHVGPYEDTKILQNGDVYS